MVKNSDFFYNRYNNTTIFQAFVFIPLLRKKFRDILLEIKHDLVFQVKALRANSHKHTPQLGSRPISVTEAFF